MNTAQSLLTLGALILCSIVSLNFYRQNDYISTSLDSDRYRIEALSMLTSQIEQLSQYYYDEASTDTSNDKAVGDMTAPGSLGFEANDSSRIDDIDDLRGLTQTRAGLSGINYRITTNVEYVILSNSRLVFSNQRQFHKRVTVSVCDAYTPPLIYHTQGDSLVRDTLRMSAVVSYWFYN